MFSDDYTSMVLKCGPETELGPPRPRPGKDGCFRSAKLIAPGSHVTPDGGPYTFFNNGGITE